MNTKKTKASKGKKPLKQEKSVMNTGLGEGFLATSVAAESFRNHRGCWVDIGNKENVEVKMGECVQDVLRMLAFRAVPVKGKTLQVTATGQTLGLQQTLDGHLADHERFTLVRLQPSLLVSPSPSEIPNPQPPVKKKPANLIDPLAVNAHSSKAGTSAPSGSGSKSKVEYSEVMTELRKIRKQNKKILSLLEEQHAHLSSGEEFLNTYKEELNKRLAKEFYLSLTREISDDKIKTIVAEVLRSDAKKKGALLAAVKWCNKIFSSFKTDERRNVEKYYKLRVYGINPYQECRDLPSEQLAEKIMRSIKAPMSFSLERTYSRNLALMRKFIRSSGKKAKQRGQLWIRFKQYLESLPNMPNPEAAWTKLLEEDREVYRGVQLQSVADLAAAENDSLSSFSSSSDDED